MDARQTRRHQVGPFKRAALTVTMLGSLMLALSGLAVTGALTSPPMQLTIDEIRAYRLLTDPASSSDIDVAAPLLTSDEMQFLDWNLWLPGGHTQIPPARPMDNW